MPPHIKGKQQVEMDDLPDSDAAILAAVQSRHYRSAGPPASADLSSALAAGNAALKRVHQFESNSSLDSEQDVMQLEWDDLDMGPQVGEGSFSNVFAISLRSPSPASSNPFHQRGARIESFLSFSDDEADSEDKDSEEQVLNQLSAACERRYALKCLKSAVTREESSFKMAAVDLALEAKLLSRLSHPNIIQLYGVTSGCVSSSFSENERGFFLVLDLMADTLDKRLELWQKQAPKTKSVRQRLRLPSAISSSIAAQLDRLEHVALGIARGLEYLHQSSIIYRDLKPENIGFDENDVVNILDFGLAREIKRDIKGNVLDLREMTGAAGTPRYMSPEMARRTKCDFSSDVYSFALLVWEICTLEKPFEEIKSRACLKQKVVHERHRPSLKKIVIKGLRPLLEQAWQDDPLERPSISAFREQLENIVQDAREATKQSPVHKGPWLRRGKSLSDGDYFRENRSYPRQLPSSISKRVKKRGKSSTFASQDSFFERPLPLRVRHVREPVTKAAYF